MLFSEEVTLKAKSQKWIEKKYWIGEGNVEVLYGEIKIEADKITYDFLNEEIEAEGNVVFKSKNGEIKTFHLLYNLKEKKGYFEGVEASFEGSYYFKGEKLEKIGENFYKLYKGEFTSCNPENPTWAFKVKKCKFQMEDYAYLSGTSFAIKNKSIIYIPYLIWPTKRDRSAGFLIPKFGHSLERGSYLGISYFLPLGEPYDFTFGLDLFSKGYYGRNFRFRYFPKENFEGKISGYLIKDEEEKNRWRVIFDHKQRAFSSFKLDAHIEALSDIDFLKEFEQVFDKNTNRQIYSYISLSGLYKNHSILFKTDRKETYITSTNKYLFQQYPKLEVRLRPFSLLSNLNFSHQFRLNYFDVDKGLNYKGKYGRVDFFPLLSYSFTKLPFLNISPSIGYRLTYYSKSLDEKDTLKGGDFLREYFYLSGKVVGPSFSKIFKREKNLYKHIIEPIIEYTELSHLKTKKNPLFDENDSIITQKQIKFTLANRVLKKTKSGSAEVFYFEISQRLSLEEDSYLTQINLDGILKKSHKGTLDFTIRANFGQGSSLMNQLSINPINKKWQSENFTLNLNFKRQMVSFSYNATNSFIENVKKTQYFRLRASLHPLKNFSLTSGLSYDITNKFASQQEYSIGFLGSCYAINLEYRDFRSLSKDNREWRLVINLKNIGSFIEFKGEISPSN